MRVETPAAAVPIGGVFVVSAVEFGRSCPYRGLQADPVPSPPFWLSVVFGGLTLARYAHLIALPLSRSTIGLKGISDAEIDYACS
jgi:hypothetical protein